jgi:hypothetical protein
VAVESQTPLIRKLGLKAGYAALVLHAPDDYAALLGEVPEGVRLDAAWPGDVPIRGVTEMYDFMHAFVRQRVALQADFPLLKAALKYNGMLWISWPKRSSAIPTDLDENLVRETGLAQGLVDVKIAAIDANWSGLKFVYRIKDRHGTKIK